MKHSEAGSMISPCGEGVEGGLSVSLCNLIVDSRTPTRDPRGYGAGTHCPPLLGPNSHVCESQNTQCQKHQTILHHLLEAAASNVFQIEVLLLPDCCLESKLKERVQNKEYILVERWSMNFIQSNTETNVEVSQLLRAVRSFLHFSQLSAWLSSTSGKSPTNICYWVNPKLEALSTKFKAEPEVHLFPICKVNEDLYGRVKVEFPARTQYIPIIPCSKHPPICRYSLREINKDSDLCQKISLDPQIVMQLHKTCDTEPTAINYVPEPTTVMLTPTSLLKTFSAAIPDGSKTNRVHKYSNLQGNLFNSESLPLDVKCKTIDIIPKKPTTFICNYAETISLGVNQENFCGNKRKLAGHLCKTELKLKKNKKDVSTTLASQSLASILSSDIYKLNQNTLKHSIKVSDVPRVSNLLDQKGNENSLLNSIESSLVNLEKHTLSGSCNLSRQLSKTTKGFKLKESDLNIEEKCVLPYKDMCCDINLSPQIFKSYSAVKYTTSLPQCTKTSQLKEKVKRDDEFQEYSSSTNITLSNYANNIKMLKANNQNCSNDLFPFQCTSKNMSAQQKQEFSDSHINAKMVSKSLLRKSFKKSKTNISRNSELRLSKRKSQLDYQTNEKKKSKSVEESNMFINLHSDAICNISRPHFRETKQTYCPDSKVSDNINSLKRYFFKRNNLEKLGPPKQPCSSWIDSKAMYSNSKQIVANAAPSNAILKSNSCVTDNSMKKYHLYHRKLSLNCSKSSLSLQSLKNKEKKFQVQETNLKSYRLFFDSNEMSTQKNVSDISNVNSENLSNAKPISSWDHECKTSNMFKTEIESVPLVISKERVLKRTLSKNTFLIKNPVLRRKGNVEEKTVHQPLIKNLKLNKLFKIKKNYCQKKISQPLSLTYLQFGNKSNSSQTVSKKSTTLSLNECQNNIFSNVPNELISNGSANSLTELQRPTLTGITISKDVCEKNDSSFKKISLQNKQSSFVLNTPVPTASRNLCQITDENLECFPNRIAKFPKRRKLLMNFEESILKGCLPMVSNVKGFRAEIGASGSFCPNHLTLPANVSFYELGHPYQGTAPYVAHVSLTHYDYYLPKKGAVQVTLFNPSETVVKMFVLNYDLSSMPPLCHTFIRQKTYSLPIGLNKEHPASQKWLRFIIHLRFASSKTGRISLHEDFKIVVLNKTNDDAASEFNQEPRELCSFLSVPMNPTFSNICI